MVRFGISVGSWPLAVPPSGEYLYGLAERVEALGYDGLWSGDHFVTQTPFLHALTLLGAFAARTTRVTLGTSVLILPLHNVAETAKAVSTLDFLCGGRFVLGVGVGGEMKKEWEVAGVPLGDRGRRADEYIQALRALWTSDAASFSGRYCQFADVNMQPKPAQPGGPPILVGGRSDAALVRAGRLADGWMAYMVTSERYAESVEKMRAAAMAARRDPGRLRLAHLIFWYVGRDHEQARSLAITNLSRRYNQPFDKLVDKYCAVGSPEACAEALRSFVAAGVDELVFMPIAPPDELLDQIAMLAEDVRPLVRTG
ncbi:MAG: LLM class flavin-dependent oxidoreductase [Chloroflexi bacterium]|nr:LLM class flavin-dependent oxidoreductase [Chloroflexota bacterium]